MTFEEGDNPWQLLQFVGSTLLGRGRWYVEVQHGLTNLATSGDWLSWISNWLIVAVVLAMHEQ